MADVNVNEKQQEITQNLAAGAEEELYEQFDLDTVNDYDVAVASAKKGPFFSLDGKPLMGVNYFHQRIRAVRWDLNRIFPQRASVVHSTMVALLTRENVLLLGPPGTAKSALIRAIAQTFLAEDKYFERLVTKFSTPEELFGPLSLKALDEDRYERVVKGYLPTAYFAFIDEIFKANSSILNAMLTIINEHLYSNGADLIKVPLITMFAASNEMPEEKVLDALFDRFVLRHKVDYLKRPSDFRKMVLAKSIAPTALWNIVPKKKLPLPEFDEDGYPTGKMTSQFKEGWNYPLLDENEEPYMPLVNDVTSKSFVYMNHLLTSAQKYAAKQAVVTDATMDAMMEVRSEMNAAGFEVSDRRWKKCLTLAKANAFINGATNDKGQLETAPEDLALLVDSLWAKAEQRAPIYAILAPITASFQLKVQSAVDDLKMVTQEIETVEKKYLDLSGGRYIKGEHFPGYITETAAHTQTFRTGLKTLTTSVAGAKPRDRALVQDLVNEAIGLRDEINARTARVMESQTIHGGAL